MERKTEKINEILNRIQNGELELVDYKGQSIAWTKFSKIRDVVTKACVEYVQCKRCKVLRTFSKKNGTTTLNRHECKIPNINPDGKAMDNNNFVEVSQLVSTEIKNIFIQKAMEACAIDLLPVGTFVGPGIVKLIQSAISIGEKFGNVNVRSLFPSVVAINRHIRSLIEDDLLKTEEDVKEAFNKNMCSASATCHTGSNFNESQIISVSVKYFSSDLSTLEKKIVFTIPITERSCTESRESNFYQKFKNLGLQDVNIQRLNIVTPNTPMFSQTFKTLVARETCIAFKINSILNASFAACTGEISDIFINCREVVQILIKTERMTKLKEPISDDIGSWKKKCCMIKTVNTQYDEIMNLLTEDEKAKLSYNKLKGEQLMDVLQVFIDAIEDLRSSNFTTCNKILPYWGLIRDHLNKPNKYAPDVKKFIFQVKAFFGNEFIPTLDQKIASFLDPRFRTLKMLTQNERKDVLLKVRFLLSKMPSAAPKVNRDNEPEAKKSRFSEFEANDGDMVNQDEVNTYIYTIQSESYELNKSEFNLIEKFWKDNQRKLPKLFHLAISRLHVAACCCTEDSLATKKLSPDEFKNLLHTRSRMFDLW